MKVDGAEMTVSLCKSRSCLNVRYFTVITNCLVDENLGIQFSLVIFTLIWSELLLLCGPRTAITPFDRTEEKVIGVKLKSSILTKDIIMIFLTLNK